MIQHLMILQKHWKRSMIKIETYAQALFEVVKDPLKVYEDVKSFQSLLQDEEVLKVFAINYAEPEVLDPLWHVLTYEDETIRLLKILQNDQRILDFDRFLESFQELMIRNKQLSKAHVEVASALDAQEVENLKSLLAAKYPGLIELDVVENKSLIKGMVMRVNHDVIDTSLKHKLEQIKHQGRR